MLTKFKLTQKDRTEVLVLVATLAKLDTPNGTTQAWHDLLGQFETLDQLNSDTRRAQEPRISLENVVRIEIVSQGPGS